MRFSKKLTRVLRDLVALIDDEASRNPGFAERLEIITADLPERGRKTGTKKSATAAPDVSAAFQEKGEEEFRFWLRTLDLLTLKAIVKINGFDPAKVSQRWRDSDKFVSLITEQTSARLRRGSAFVSARKSLLLRAESKTNVEHGAVETSMDASQKDG